MFSLVPPQLIANDISANPASPLSTSSSGFGGGRLAHFLNGSYIPSNFQVEVVQQRLVPFGVDI